MRLGFQNDSLALYEGTHIAFSVAEHWKKVYLDPDYRLYLYGKDDPSVVALVGEIEETKKKIAALEDKVAGREAGSK